MSLVATGFLAVAGTISIGIVSKRRQWRFFFFALIPLLFAIQQLCEAFVWWSVANNHPYWNTTFSFAFLFFAFFLWPIWIPLSLVFIERNKKILFTILTAFGALVGALLLFVPLIQQGSFNAFVVERSLCYSSLSLFPYPLGFILYLIATVGSTLFSSYPTVKALGAVIAFSAVVSYFVSQFAFVSVWCFFSALLSAMVIWIVLKETELSI